MTNTTTQEMYFDTIIQDLKAMSAKQVYQKLCKHVSNLIGTSEKLLFDVIIENEQSQNSGIGNGVAVAHAKLPRLTRPMIIYTKLNNEIDFKTADGEFVDLVCLVLSPEFEGPKHLQRLSMVTRFFSDAETRDALRSAEDYDSVRIAVKQMNERRKAA